MPDYSKMTNEELFRASMEKPKGLDDLPNEALFHLAQNEIKEKQYVKPFKNVFEYGLEAAAPVVSPLLEFSSKYAGAPIGAGIAAKQSGKSWGESLKAAGKQFGEDPSNAPTGKDIAIKAGVSAKEYEPLSFYQRFYAPEDRTKISAAGVVGGGIDIAKDPLTYLAAPAVSGVKKGIQVAGPALKQAAPKVISGIEKGYTKTLEGVSPKVAKVIAPIEEKNVKGYLQRSESINKLKDVTLEDLKNVIDADVGEIASAKNAASTALKEEVENLKSAFKDKKFQLSQDVAPLSQAREIMTAIEQEKAFLGSLSEQANDALVRSGKTFLKRDLLDAIDKVGASSGKYVVSDTAENALNKMMKTRQRIAEGLPDVIDAPTMRDVLRQLRDDMDFAFQAGEFNTSLGKMQTKFTKMISDALKDPVSGSPEYAQYMLRMQELSQNLGKMKTYFGTDTKALSSLETLRKGGAQAQVIKDALENYVKSSGRADILEKVNVLENRYQAFERLKNKGPLEEFFPEEVAKIRELTKIANELDATYKQVERLTPQRSQNIINSLMNRKEPIIEDRRAVERLSKITGKDYLQSINDVGILRSFTKEGTHGSRLTYLGSSIGAGLGGLLGVSPLVSGPIGAMIGATGDKYAGRAIKKSLDVGLKGKEKLNALQRRAKQGAK